MIDRHEISEISEYNVDEYRRFDDEGPVVQREGGGLSLSLSLALLSLSLSHFGGVHEANAEAEGIGGGGGYPDSR